MLAGIRHYELQVFELRDGTWCVRIDFSTPDQKQHQLYLFPTVASDKWLFGQPGFAKLRDAMDAFAVFVRRHHDVV